MNEHIGSLRTILLSLSLDGGGKITPKQEEWLLNWIGQKFERRELDKVAEIAYQYNYPDDIVQKIKSLK